MDIAKLGAQLLASKLGGGGSQGIDIQSALQGLMGQGKGGVDLGSLVGKMMGGDNQLGNLAKSWLGDGDNEPMSTDQVKGLFGGDQLSQFASKLGVDESTATRSLQDALPQMVDKASSGGSLLDAVGGMGGLLSLGKKFLN